MCLQTQHQAVRVTLKELESLSFDITNADILKNLSCKLEAKCDLQKQISRMSSSTRNYLIQKGPKTKA